MRNPLFRPALLAASVAVAASAQTQAAAIEEVIVTAQKREQTLQDVPSAVSAISSDYVSDLLGAGENIRALAGRVPSLQIESSNGRQSPRFYIRGLGNYDFDVNATQPVSLIYDEVALENSVLKSLPLFDVAQIEVLKGPQGTLFGRSTTAGVVKVDSVRPTYEPDGYVKAGYGSRGTLTTEGAFGGGFSDTVAGRVSLRYLERDAWIDNTANGAGDDFGGFDEFAYRVQLLVEPSDELSALFKLHGFHQEGDQPQVFYANAFTPGTSGLRSDFDEDVASHDFEASDFDLDHIGASAEVEYDFGGVTLTSVTAYDQVDSFSQADIDGGITNPDYFDNLFGAGILPSTGESGFPVNSGDGLSDHYQFTQEIRFSGETDAIFWQAGLFYFDEDITVRSSDFDNTGVATATTYVDQKTESIAIFGQAEFSVTDQLAITAGLRWTEDDKDLEVYNAGGNIGSADGQDGYLSWELAANYDFTESVTLYSRLATASRGPVTLGRFGVVTEADTETITSFEIGVKTDLFNDRARWNATVYGYQIEDHQLTATGGTDNVNRLLNAEDTTGEGFETDLEAFVTDNFKVTFNLSYTKTEVNDSTLLTDRCSGTPSCTVKDPLVATVPGPFGDRNLVSIDGNPVPRTPEWMYNIILDYKIPVGSGAIYLQTDWNYRDDSNIFLYESVEFIAEERWIGGAKIGYQSEDETFDVALVGRNITDEVVADGALDFLNPTAFVNEPRFLGVEVSKNF